MIQIRYAKVEDASAWTDINLKTWRTTYYKIFDEEVFLAREKDRSAKIERLINNISNKTNYHAVATYNDEVIGFMCYGKTRPHKNISDSEYAEIYAIYLLEQYQGQGIGRTMLEYATKDLSEVGFKKVIIWTLKENPNISFYKKMGGNKFDEKPISFLGKDYQGIGFIYKL